MTELSESPEHTNIDLRALGIIQNEANSSNSGEIKNKSTASEIDLNKQSMEINGQNQSTYAEARSD